MIGSALIILIACDVIVLVMGSLASARVKDHIFFMCFCHSNHFFLHLSTRIFHIFCMVYYFAKNRCFPIYISL